MASQAALPYYPKASEGKGPAPARELPEAARLDRAQGLGHRPGKQDQAGAMPLAHRIGVAMPKGPRGEKRPGDVIGAAITVAKIATGEVEDSADETKTHHRRGGQKGGASRAAKLSPERRREIAQVAAKKRWRASEGSDQS